VKRKRHSPEQIVRKLRDAEAELAGGKSIDEVCRKLEVSRQTYFRWKKEYGGTSSLWRNPLSTGTHDRVANLPPSIHGGSSPMALAKRKPPSSRRCSSPPPP
jgi:transposase-like protein